MTPYDDNRLDRTAALREEMAQTRARLSTTIDALQVRLDPERLKEEATVKVRDTTSRLKEQATETVREATIGKLEEKVDDIVNRVDDTARDARYSIADTIRQNPIPAALIGIGLGWMFFNGSDRPRQSRRPYIQYDQTNQAGYRTGMYGGTQPAPVSPGAIGRHSIRDTAQNVVGQAGDQVDNLTGQVRGTVQDLSEQAQDQVGNIAGQVKGTVQQLGDQAQGRVENLAGQVEDISYDVQNQVQSISNDVQLQARQLSGSFERVLYQNPLTVAAVAVALGAAVGMVTPTTRKEAEVLGPVRERVMQKAQVAAHEAMDEAQKIADDVQSAASARHS